VKVFAPDPVETKRGGKEVVGSRKVVVVQIEQIELFH